MRSPPTSVRVPITVVTVLIALAITGVVSARLGGAPGLVAPLSGVGAVLLAGATTTTTTTAAVVVVASIAVTAQHPLGWPVAAGLVVGLGIGAYRAVGHGVRVRSSWRGGVLTVDDGWPAAFAVPGRGAVVVLTTGLREALPDDEMAAVIRHERAHLRCRHHLYIDAVEVAAKPVQGVSPGPAGRSRTSPPNRRCGPAIGTCLPSQV